MSDNTNQAAWLQQLVGKWSGTARTWLEPGKLLDEQPVTGEIRPILGGRFVLHESRTMIDGDLSHGIAICGFNQTTQAHEMSWVDTWHTGTGIMFCVGDSAESFSVLGHYDAPSGPPWGWRTTIELPDANHLIVTMYNITPDGQSAKASELRYQRL